MDSKHIPGGDTPEPPFRLGRSQTPIQILTTPLSCFSAECLIEMISMYNHTLNKISHMYISV